VPVGTLPPGQALPYLIDRTIVDSIGKLRIEFTDSNGVDWRRISGSLTERSTMPSPASDHVQLLGPPDPLPRPPATQPSAPQPPPDTDQASRGDGVARSLLGFQRSRDRWRARSSHRGAHNKRKRHVCRIQPSPDKSGAAARHRGGAGSPPAFLTDPDRPPRTPPIIDVLLRDTSAGELPLLSCQVQSHKGVTATAGCNLGCSSPPSGAVHPSARIRSNLRHERP
jgi:hypothetical protein